MFRKVSLKAFVVSNLAHWLLLAVGLVFSMALYAAYVTISSDGDAGLKAVLQGMRSSTGFLAAVTLLFFLIPILTGYIAAKIALRGPLLNGVLSVAVWFVICAYDAIQGGESTPNLTQMPDWLIALASYAIPLPALFGAYLWRLRADRRQSISEMTKQQQSLAIDRPDDVPVATKPGKLRRRSRVVLGGLFLFLLLRLVPNEHARTMIMIALAAAVALMIASAVALKAIRRGFA